MNMNTIEYIGLPAGLSLREIRDHLVNASMTIDLSSPTKQTVFPVLLRPFFVTEAEKSAATDRLIAAVRIGASFSSLEDGLWFVRAAINKHDATVGSVPMFEDGESSSYVRFNESELDGTLQNHEFPKLASIAGFVQTGPTTWNQYRPTPMNLDR